MGLRDYEYKLGNDDTYRILIIGDSFVEGYGVELNQSFPKLIEELFNSYQNKNVEVISAGVAGWGPLPQYLYLKYYGVNFKPDLVILAFNPTDFHDQYNYYSILNVAPEDITSEDLWGKLVFKAPKMFTETVNDQTTIPLIPNSFKFFLNQHSVTYRIIARITKAFLGKANTVQTVSNEDIGNVQRDTFASIRIDKPQDYQDMLERSAADIQNMNTLIKKQGAKFLVIEIPFGNMISKEEWSKGRVLWGFQNGVIYPEHAFGDLKKALNGNGIDVFDLTPVLRSVAGGKELYFRYDGHLNEHGHKLTGAILYSYLNSRYGN